MLCAYYFPSQALTTGTRKKGTRALPILKAALATRHYSMGQQTGPCAEAGQAHEKHLKSTSY